VLVIVREARNKSSWHNKTFFVHLGINYIMVRVVKGRLGFEQACMQSANTNGKVSAAEISINSVLDYD
jgi:hypothetical protein